MSPSKSRLLVWHVGGEDVHMRVPLLLKLREIGFSVAAVGSSKHPLFAEHGITFHHYPLSRIANPLHDWQAHRSLEALCRKYRPDVVHAFDTRPALLTPSAAAKAKIPVRIRTITGMGRVFSSLSLSTVALRLVYRQLQRRASRLCLTVFQNQDDREYFLEHGMVELDREALVPGSGVDVDALETIATDPVTTARLKNELGLEGKLVVTLIARLIPEKGVREFLEAAEVIARTRTEAKFLLVGPLSAGGRQPITLTEIERQAPHVSYLGSRSDIPAILHLTDIFALPTYYREGVPRVLLEAGALGIPLITTDTPGCRDVVQDGVQGLLVPPRDAEGLQRAMERLLDSRELRLALGTNCRSHVVDHFSLPKVAEAYAELYRRQLAA